MSVSCRDRDPARWRRHVPRVLVADRNPHVRRVVGRALEDANFEVSDASTGPLALALVRAERADIALLDVALPTLDGWTVLKRIRETHVTPVILMSANGGSVDAKRAIAAGADDFLVKPLAASDLIERISELLRIP